MALVELRIELPAYSHSFTVQVQQSSRVRDVKHEITKSCPGEPRAEGQRLVCMGRLLEDDEKVEDIWKSPDDSRVIHLAVHPSAWPSSPPEIPPPPAPYTSRTPRYARPSIAVQLHAPNPTPPLSPLSYVTLKHQIAIGVLMSGTVAPSASNLVEPERWRAIAIEALQNCGWSWPSILDEDYPPSGSQEEGVKYEQVTLGGLPYLSLITPNATPTPIQVHAFKVLTLTFSILSLPEFSTPHYPPPPNYAVSYQINPHTNLNEHLQRIGLPPIRLTPGQIPNANPNVNPHDAAAPAVEVRAIPVRALIIPLVMFVFRTILLMYFFSPSKRPLFGLLLSVWILYEAWGAIRVVLGEGRPRRGDANGAMGVAGAGQAANRQPGQAARPTPGTTASNTNRSQIQAFLDGLSNLNLAMEDAIVNGDPRVSTRPPSTGHKVKTFVSLLLLTLYPAVWDHRRAALRRREGRLRTEANAREATQSPEDVGGDESASASARARVDLPARHERRPAWVKQYVQRVQATEWADDI